MKKNAAQLKPQTQFDGDYQTAIRELIAALELCLECEGLSWEAEHEAEILIARYKPAISTE